MGALAATSATVLAERSYGASTSEPLPGAPSAGPAKRVLETFDFSGVKLRPSRWQRQYENARNFYFGLSNDDILHGFRAAAGVPAPGQSLGGWAARSSYMIFGQWLMAMARASQGNDDAALRDKASLLVTEWGKTLVAEANLNIGHYGFEKMVGGLLDMHTYAGHPEALNLLDKITDHAIVHLKRDRIPAQNLTVRLTDGYPAEWYTVGENLFRVFQVTGNAKYKEFAEVWLYPAYWDKFADTANPAGVQGFHAYSHLNTFSSAALAYAVNGDPRRLRILQNAYDFFQNVQCYATGGFGPAEKLMPDDGALGDSLESRIDNFETPCGSWAGFKLSKYLQEFSGEPRYTVTIVDCQRFTFVAPVTLVVTFCVCNGSGFWGRYDNLPPKSRNLALYLRTILLSNGLRLEWFHSHRHGFFVGGRDVHYELVRAQAVAEKPGPTLV